jgi:spermidine/putrescine transport system permease protein
MTGGIRRRTAELLASTPSMLWLVVLFLLPTLIVFAISLRPPDPSGGVGPGWTLETVRSLQNPSYPAIIWRTLRLSAAATLICLAFGFPVGYFLARAPERYRSTLMLLVIVPFWTNFLVRIFAWKVLLHPEGLLKQLFVWLHLADAQASLMYNEGAVLLVLVYTYLPFAILPIHAAVEKFDFSLLDAARDLGCTPLRALYKVLLPGVSRGLATAALVVFIPALGSYVIPDIMGGPTSEMVGNKIAQRVFVDRNLPHASALSALLTLAVAAPMLVIVAQQHRRRRGKSLPGGIT